MMNDLAQTIVRASHKVLPSLVDKLRTGIRTVSVNPLYEGGLGEYEFQILFASELERLGCRVHVWEPDADALVAFCPRIREFIPRTGFHNRPNVVGLVPSADSRDDMGAHLVLNSHADTVAPADLSAWSRPPFGASLCAGCVYGLGAADAKGCLYAFLGALMALRAAGVGLRHRVALQCVVDEESGGAGTVECIRIGYTAAAAVVGEPTSLKVCPGSRGSIDLTLKVIGRKAHPGEAWRGVNAIQVACRYIEALEGLCIGLDRDHMTRLWSPLPVGHVSGPMAIDSGPRGSAIPDHCELVYNIGAIGCESMEDLRKAAETAIARVTASDDWLSGHPPEVIWAKRFYEPSTTDPTHPAVTAMIDAGVDLKEHPVAQALSAVTDARHLTNIGKIPAINFGPGDLHLCHSTEEMLRVEDLRRAVAWLALFMIRYCGIVRGPSISNTAPGA
jgi:acetylornithine deacetylase